jgi:putative SOS response-associated peptidase YedK
MPPNFPESDWRILSRLKPLALDRLCERFLLEAEDTIVHARQGEHHRVYLDLYKRIHARDKTLGNCFNHWSRSQALTLLINWRAENLLTDEEFNDFSVETRAIVDGFLKRG